MSNTFEHVLAFADEATAIADPVVGAWHVGTDWDRSVCITGLRCWDSRQDVQGVDGDGNPTVTHTYHPAFWMCIGLPAVNPALRDHACMRLLADHNAREVTKAPVNVWCLKTTTVTLADVPFFHVEP